jgi:hypothetical protein
VCKKVPVRRLAGLKARGIAYIIIPVIEKISHTPGHVGTGPFYLLCGQVIKRGNRVFYGHGPHFTKGLVCLGRKLLGTAVQFTPQMQGLPPGQKGKEQEGYNLYDNEDKNQFGPHAESHFCEQLFHRVLQGPDDVFHVNILPIHTFLFN